MSNDIVLKTRVDPCVKAGRRAEADLPKHTASPPGQVQPVAMTFPALAPAHHTSLQASVTAAGEDGLDRHCSPCPQGGDCTGDGKHERLFDCEEGCGFRGCAACMELHEAAPHVSDSDTMLEMVRGLGGAW